MRKRFRVNLRSISRRFVFVTSALVIAGILIGAYLYFFPKPASAAWFNESWLYRKALTVTVSSSASDISSLETLVTVDTSASGKFQSSCQDLRFTNQKGELLPYYIDSGCGTDSTKVWVLADLVPKNTTTYMMYMYYGNPSAPAASDSTKFRLFNGLVGYWAMNESAWAGAAGEVKDSSINANNGVRVADATTTASGKYSYGGTFDGTGDYVDIGDITLIDGATQLTVSTWFKSSSATNQVIFAKGYTNNTFNVKIDSSNSYKLYWGVDNATTGASALSNSAVNDGNWHHMVGTWNGSVLDLYLDGVKQTSQGVLSGGSIQNTTDKLAIGAFLASNDSAASLLTGQADDARIYNRALSESEISQLYTNPGNITSNANATTKPSTAAGSEEQSPGPVGYWAFDDGQGQTAQDSSSSNNDGTITGATWQPEDRCVSGKCLRFDGSDDYVEVTDSNSLHAQTITVSAWIRNNSTDANPHQIVSKRGPIGTNFKDWQLLVDYSAAGKVTVNIPNGDSDVLATTDTAVVTANQWTHVAFTFDNSTRALNIYVNGVNKKSITNANTMNNNGKHITIGALDHNGMIEEFTGFIDDVKIYPYAQTAAQIKADYNSGKANAGTNSGAGAVLGAQPQDYLSNGLVGYWKMDDAGIDAEGETSTDSSGNGNSGTLYGDNGAGDNGTGMNCTASGKYGTSCNFDGTDDYVSFGNLSGVYNSTGFTWSMWFNASSTSGTQDLMSKWATDGGDERGVSFIIYQEKLRVFSGCGGTAAVTSDTTPSTGTWYHAVVVGDSSKFSLYINGELENTGTSCIDLNSHSQPFTIGDRSTGSNFFNGSIDEARVYNRALSPKEISSLYNWAPGPVGYWDFEEGGNIGVGSTAFDRSGNSNPGIWKGTGAKHTDTGKYGKAGKFNGSDDYVDAGDPSSGIFDFGTGDFTISAWVKPNALADGDGIIFKNEGAGNKQYRIRLTDSNGNLQVESYDGTTEREYTSTTNPLSIGKWTHISGVREQNSIKLYANGVLLGSTAGAAVDVSNSANLKIGLGPGSDYFNGTIDDVKVYNYARSVKQVISDMNAGHPNVGSPVGSAVGHWDFDEGQGTVANNSGSGGSTYNGTITNATWSQAGKFNRALNFTASNSEYVSVTSPVNTTANTVSAWFKVTTNAANQGVLSAGNSIADGLPYLLLQNNSGTLRIYNADFDYATVSSISTATWYFVTIVNAGTNQKVYLNGIQKLNRTIGGGNNTNFYIGAGYNATFDGIIDEVKVYNYALTADEVKLDYNRGSSMVLGSLGNLSTLSNSAAGQEYCIPGDSSTCTAPVARWDFEERADNTCSGGTNDVCDTSGSGYDGAWNGTGAKHWAAGKVGSAGKFNGTDDYVSITDNLNLGNNNFTISAWFNAAVLGNFIASKRDGDASNIEWNLAAGANPSFSIFASNGGAADVVTSSTAITANGWHHITAVHDATNSKIKLYLDGALVGSTDKTQTIADSASPFRIGARHSTPEQFFNGKIDQVKIFNYARSAAQVAYDYNRGAPIGHWDFDECQGATAYDQSGNNNHGTITIGATDEATLGTCTTSSTAWGSGATGKRNASLSFDGDDDYVNTNYSLPASNELTFSAWVKTTNGGWYVVGNHYSAGVGFLGNKSGTNYATLRYKGAGDSEVVVDGATTNIKDGNWHHLAGTISSTNGGVLYVDGRIEKTSSTVSGITGGTIYIGTQNGSVNFFDGQIDDVKIFNYVLTATQVKNEYNGGAVRFGPVTGSP